MRRETDTGRLLFRRAALIFAATNTLAVAAAVARGFMPLPAVGLPVLLAAGALVLAARLGGGAAGRPFPAKAIATTLASRTAGRLWPTAFAWL